MYFGDDHDLKIYSMFAFRLIPQVSCSRARQCPPTAVYLSNAAEGRVRANAGCRALDETKYFVFRAYLQYRLLRGFDNLSFYDFTQILSTATLKIYAEHVHYRCS